MIIYTIQRKLTLVFILALSSKFLLGQALSENFQYFDAKYGYNPVIYKGAKYMSEHRQQFGHPFFQQETNFIGNVKAKNYTLDSVELWYDIYKHYLVYGYKSHIGSQQKIILNAKEVERFSLSNMVFVRNHFQNISSAYLHEIVVDSVSCFKSYRKTYKMVNNNSKKGFGYTDQVDRVYLAYNNEAYLLGSVKSLVVLLPENIQQQVKNYMVQHKVKPSKASNSELVLLFKYINSQL